MNRVRNKDETYAEYKSSLRAAAKVMKFRLKGRWVWKTFYPIDASTTNMPRNAVIYEVGLTGDMVPSLNVDHSKRVHFVKFPPFHASPENKRLTFSQQRKIIKHGYTQSEGPDSSPVPEVNAG